MRNIVSREREKIMMFEPRVPPDFKLDKSERELREQKLERDFNTPLPVLYIVASIIILLLIIVGILGVYVFHFL
jgi:hypothetical protein